MVRKRTKAPHGSSKDYQPKTEALATFETNLLQIMAFITRMNEDLDRANRALNRLPKFVKRPALSKQRLKNFFLCSPINPALHWIALWNGFRGITVC